MFWTLDDAIQQMSYVLLKVQRIFGNNTDSIFTVGMFSEYSHLKKLVLLK